MAAEMAISKLQEGHTTENIQSQEFLRLWRCLTLAAVVTGANIVEAGIQAAM
jgi:hypothetical protein